MLNKHCLIAILICLCASFCLAQDPYILNGKVVRIYDGDTIVIDSPDQEEWIEIRFYGIDCPETAHPGWRAAQPYSKEAKDMIVSLANGKGRVCPLEKRNHLRKDGWRGLVDGKSLSRELLKSGLA